MENEIKIIERSTQNLESLTAYEKEFLETRKNCPDCETGSLKEGPHGAASINWYCQNPDCGSMFNMATVGDHIVFAQRISMPSPKKKRMREQIGENLDD